MKSPVYAARAAAFRIIGALLLGASLQAGEAVTAKPTRVHKWVYEPRVSLPQGVTHHTFHSPSMGIDVGYSIYLPPAYAKDTLTRFPVVYWLHGGYGNELSAMKDVAPVFNRVESSGEAPPMIVVYVNGGPGGHYDLPEPQGLGETAFIKELIPHIDKNYRTLADRKHRAIEGMSLGGRGATRDIFKHPELFCTAALLGSGFGNEQKDIDAGQHLGNNVFVLAKKFAANSSLSIRLFLVVGTKDPNYASNLSYMKFLTELKISFDELIIEGAAHTYQDYYGFLGAATLKFHAESFTLAAQAPPYPGLAPALAANVEPSKAALAITSLRAGEAATRPQDPVRPVPYIEEDVTVVNHSDGIALAGTLTLPDGKGRHPAVVLVTGSGPQDRNEAVAGHRPFLVLADYLTRHGIAVLRCDDRGVGKSTGNFRTATEIDFGGDALAAVDYLRTRKEIDPSQVGLVGHSEGGMIVPRIACKQPAIAFIVLLAGPGYALEHVMLVKHEAMARSAGIDERLVTRNVSLLSELLHLIRTEHASPELERKIREILEQQATALSAEQRQALGLGEKILGAQTKRLLSPWFYDALTVDPQTNLRAVKCPVLAIIGGKDPMGAADNLTAIRSALEAGGNRRGKTVELPGLNHLFQLCQTGSASEYSTIKETINPAALKLVSSWICQVTSSSAAERP